MLAGCSSPDDNRDIAQPVLLSVSLVGPRYLRVRYEDITSSADAAVKDVYHWLGLGPVPPRVSLWLNENTRVPDCNDNGG